MEEEMKKIGYLVVALAALFITSEVNASAITDCITGAGSHTCTLDADIEVTEQLVVQGNIVLDLNGHTISVPESRPSNLTTGVIGVKRGAILTINDSSNGEGKILSGTKAYAAVAVTIPGESSTGSKATLIVNGGTLVGRYYAITGNGNRHNTSVTINGGTIRGTETNDCVGIFQPQEGTMVINGGTIEGASGIEIRAGSLIVNGGTITANAQDTVAVANGSGTTTIGAGIAIAQHTTKKEINVKIKGGDISGHHALYESDPQHNENVEDAVTLSITGGNFVATNDGDAAVYSEDVEDFIVRGTFNTPISADYIQNTEDVEQDANGNLVIGSHSADAESNGDYGVDTEYESVAYVNSVETYDVNITWDDLHWVFVYEGEITSPVRKAWVTKDYYDTTSTEKSYLTANEINGDILDNSANLPAPVLGMVVENNSTFAVDVAAAIEDINGNENYTNAAGLKLSTDSTIFDTTASVSALANSASANIYVKPTTEAFVNTTGATASVTGEVTISISKTV